MFPEGDVWSTLTFLLLLSTGMSAEKICSVHSKHEVHMGSSFQIYCIFKKECKRLIYRDEVSARHSSLNATVLIMSVVNLTRTTTVTCKCQNEPEPCGTDVVPGYPPAVPQNLACTQEGELGNVKCTWKPGWETHVKTTSHLWVHGPPRVWYESVAVRDGTRWASFPVSGTQSSFSVWIQSNNSLGSASSTVLNFTLIDIVKPLSPRITKMECSSTQCQLYPYNKLNIQLVEIRYRGTWESWNAVLINHTNSTTGWTVSRLNPYSTYTFKVRWKLGPATGLWSDWTRIEGVTDEEAPVTMLDAWYTEDPTQTVGKSFRLFWKELNTSESRGKILRYVVTLRENGISNRKVLLEHTTDVSCTSCTVSISAMNSKGLSPARLIQLQTIAVLPYKVSHTHVDNHSVALSWPKPVKVDTLTEFLVEWVPVGRKQQLQWIRVDKHLNTARIAGLQPAQCYEGALVYLHSSWTEKALFNKISTWQTAPGQGPRSSIDVKSESVEIKWGEVPPEKRGGCVERYSIYLKDSAGRIQNYSVPHPQRAFTIAGLIRGQKYRLWVSAWTKAGESPVENEHRFKPKRLRDTLDEKPLTLLISVGSAVLITCLCLLCLCQMSLVHRRLSGLCRCLKPSIVPDPANSKWAKEFLGEKGKIRLQLHLSTSGTGEEEPDTVEVEEFPQERRAEDEISTPRPADGRGRSAAHQHRTAGSYLKSLSTESSSSDNTAASGSTDVTADYISARGAFGGGDQEEEEDGDDDEEDHEAFDFFPRHRSPFLGPLLTDGGKLTLDSVKVDGGEFFNCA